MGLRKLLKSIVSGGEVVDIVNEAITQVDANAEGIKGLRGEEGVETASPKWSLKNLYDFCIKKFVTKESFEKGKTIYNLRDLDLDNGGTVSLNDFIIKMPPYSRAVICCSSGAGIRREDVPNGYGTLLIEKLTVSRCVLKYVFSESSIYVWHGVFYGSTFRGWKQISLI